MKNNVIRVIILSVVMMPLSAMSVNGTIDEVPMLCMGMLTWCNEQPFVCDGEYDEIPRYYSILPALGACCGQKVLPLVARSDLFLARIALLLSANAFAYRYPSIMVIVGHDTLKLPLFAYARDCPWERLNESFKLIVDEAKTGWEKTIFDRRMFLPLTVAASPDQWHFFYNTKTGRQGQVENLKFLDRLICAVAGLYGLSSDIYFCSEAWHASYGFLPTSPCSSPITTDDGQCYLCVRKDSLVEFDRVFGFNLQRLIQID